MQARREQNRKETAEQFFGEALRERRKERGLTQEELAFKSGYHPTYIGHLERGLKNPTLGTIMHLASALDTRGSELIRRVEFLFAESGSN